MNSYISIGYGNALNSGVQYTIINRSRVNIHTVHNGNTTVLSSDGLLFDRYNDVYYDGNEEALNSALSSIQMQTNIYQENNNIDFISTNIGIMGVKHKDKFVSWSRIFAAVEKIEEM